MLRTGWGVAGIFSDDGWVDHDQKTVMPPDYSLYYPARMKLGDLFAVGHCTADEVVIGSFRICRVTSIREAKIMAVLGRSRFTYGFEHHAGPFELWVGG